jgi:hypothetical protein
METFILVVALGGLAIVVIAPLIFNSALRSGADAVSPAATARRITSDDFEIVRREARRD